MIQVLRFISTALHRLCDWLGIPYYCDRCGVCVEPHRRPMVEGTTAMCEKCCAERNAQTQRELCEENVDFDFDVESREGRYGR